MDDTTRLKTRLSRSALGTARARGHNMSRVTWQHEQGEGLSRDYAVCTNCGMCLKLDTYPPPNGIDISGEAVALNCKGVKNHAPIMRAIYDEMVGTASN